MLQGKLARNGYDWWWHSLVGEEKKSGRKKPFFIEYFVINPALGGEEPILGQKKEHKENNSRPSYAMLKAGAWGENDSAQIHNFYGIHDFVASKKRETVKIGPHFATERHLKGHVKVTKEEARQHPEWMSDPGDIRWNLRAEKVLSYDVGYGTSQLFRLLHAFQMYWHVQGMLTRYKGSISFNGKEYEVQPDSSCGYQDKNWGTNFANPWLWLNCNHFTLHSTGNKVKLTSLDVGGARPVIYDFPLPKKLLICFYLEGQKYEWNFAKFWTRPRQHFDFSLTDQEAIWDITARNQRAKIEIHFSCPRSHMMLFNYENPRGEKKHTQLWNGGHASGWVNLYYRKGTDYEFVGRFDGKFGGCEYGEHKEEV